MNNLFHIEYVYNSIFFLYAFFLTSTISNAGLSISLAFLLMILISIFVKREVNIQIPDKVYLVLYTIFLED